jgi:hypothetical protein
MKSKKQTYHNRDLFRNLQNESALEMKNKSIITFTEKQQNSHPSAGDDVSANVRIRVEYSSTFAASLFYTFHRYMGMPIRITSQNFLRYL